MKKTTLIIISLLTTLFVISLFITSNAESNDNDNNYYSKLFNVEYKSPSHLNGKVFESKENLRIIKGLYLNCKEDPYTNPFCLSNKESTHFVQIKDKNKQLDKPVKYKVYAEYRLVSNSIAGRFFNAPIPMIILETNDGKKIEMNTIFFNNYISKNNKYNIQNDMKRKY
jgi:hypothetical protein